MGNQGSKIRKQNKMENQEETKVKPEEKEKNVNDEEEDIDESLKMMKIIFLEAEKEEEKIIIEDFSKELKIHPRKIKQLDEEIFKRLHHFFDDYKCSICLFKIIINIERKEDNLLLKKKWPFFHLKSPLKKN